MLIRYWKLLGTVLNRTSSPISGKDRRLYYWSLFGSNLGDWSVGRPAFLE